MLLEGALELSLGEEGPPCGDGSCGPTPSAPWCWLAQGVLETLRPQAAGWPDRASQPLGGTGWGSWERPQGQGWKRTVITEAQVLCPQPSKKKRRAQVIEFLIDVARECFNIGNFNSLMAIVCEWRAPGRWVGASQGAPLCRG